MNTGTDPPVDV